MATLYYEVTQRCPEQYPFTVFVLLESFHLKNTEKHEK